MGNRLLISLAALAAAVVTFTSAVQLSGATAPQSVPSASHGGGGGCC